jgi:hypothetical protein
MLHWCISHIWFRKCLFLPLVITCNTLAAGKVQPFYQEMCDDIRILDSIFRASIITGSTSIHNTQHPLYIKCVNALGRCIHLVEMFAHLKPARIKWYTLFLYTSIVTSVISRSFLYHRQRYSKLKKPITTTYDTWSRNIVSLILNAVKMMPNHVKSRIECAKINSSTRASWTSVYIT